MLAEREKKLESTVAELRHENSVAKAQKVESDSRLVKLKGEYTGLQNKHVALEKDRNALKARTSSNGYGKTKQRDGPAPEHIRRNIARVAAAQAERQRTSYVLPTAIFVQGGSMSKK